MRGHLNFGLTSILTLALGLVLIPGTGMIGRAEYFTKGQDVEPFTFLKNGQYAWHPEISPSGPVVIVVSIPEQRLFVYRNGVRIGKSTVSTGRTGHPTPTGVFTILQKQVDHTSTIYKGASMPYMQRLTWGGIALHAGYLPGFTDSHGCIRLPLDFAEKLYTVTAKGTTVIVTNGEATPVTTPHPGYLLTAQGNEAASEKVGDDDYEWNPQLSATGPVSIIYSVKSERIYVFRNGVEIGRAAAQGGEDIPVGIQAYTALATSDSEGHREWSAILTGSNDHPMGLRELAKHLSIPPAFLTQVRTVIEPGTTLVISDAPTSRAQPVTSGGSIFTSEGTK